MTPVGPDETNTGNERAVTIYRDVKSATAGAQIDTATRVTLGTVTYTMTDGTTMQVTR